MDVAIGIVGFVTVVASAIVAGGQIFCLVALLPAMPGWPSDMSAIVHRDAMTDRPHHFLRRFAMLMIASAVATLVLIVVDGDSWPAVVVFAAGLAAALVSTGISSREWPINEEIKSWGDAPKADRYAELRRLWDLRHVRRTWLSTFAFAAFVAALLLAVGA